LSANTSYWVLVYNGLPATYNQNSATAAIQVVTSLTGNGPLVALVNEAFLPAPAFIVKDSTGALVSNYPVALTVNEASAGARFGGLTNITAISDATGKASAVLTANALAGAYTVTASNSPVVTSTIGLLNVAQLAVNTVTDEDNGSIDPSLGTGLSLREAVNYAATHPGAHERRPGDTPFDRRSAHRRRHHCGQWARCRFADFERRRSQPLVQHRQRRKCRVEFNDPEERAQR
jgi:hypothetical protein